ncbi:MAG: DUF4129 domain-containing protein [Anaerolineales bacterium]|jgi:hypothetical protein
MRQTKRFMASFLVFLSIVALILLSSGLSSLKLKPGVLFQDGLMRELQELLWASEGLLDLTLVLFIILPVIAAILISLQPLRSNVTLQRKRSILTSIIQLGFLILAILLLKRRVNLQDFQLEVSKRITGNIADFNIFTSQTAVSSLPWWLNFILSFLLIGTVLLIIVRALFTTQSNQNPVPLISKKAELTVDAINRGKNFNNVILDCYYEMTRILLEQRGLSLEKTVTPREFEKQLLNLGFSEKPVIWLTRIFERVRYGNLEIEEEDQKLAIHCLEEIRDEGENF